jgi:hypothetical protein
VQRYNSLVALVVLTLFGGSCGDAERDPSDSNAIASRSIELSIIATYATPVPPTVEPFDYDEADRRTIRVIDVSGEHYDSERRSLRLTLDPATAVELNAWVPHGVNCDLSLIVDREVVANLYTRTPFDDVLYVHESMNDFEPGSGMRVEEIESRIRAASDLSIDAEYAPSLDESSWIELERPACSQRCPQYTLRVHGDGAITYVGSAGVARVGRRDGSIDGAAVRRLFARFAAARFFELPDESVTDRDDVLPSVLALSVGGRTKKCVRRTAASSAIDPYPTLGETLELLANAVDFETQSRHWVGKSDRIPRPIVRRSADYRAQDPTSLDIRFKRQGTWSPVYEISVRDDGFVQYRGIHDVPFHGTATTSISRDSVDELVDRFQSIHFWTLEDHYWTGAMDEPVVTITFSIDGRTKSVVNRWSEFSSPDSPNHETHLALDELGRAIEAAVDSQAWFAPNDWWWDRSIEAGSRARR